MLRLFYRRRLLKSDTANQVRKPGVGAQRIDAGIDPQEVDQPVPAAEGLLEELERPIALAERGLDEREHVGGDVALPTHGLELAADLFGFGGMPRERVEVPEVAEVEHAASRCVDGSP